MNTEAKEKDETFPAFLSRMQTHPGTDRSFVGMTQTSMKFASVGLSKTSPRFRYNPVFGCVLSRQAPLSADDQNVVVRFSELEMVAEIYKQSYRSEEIYTIFLRPGTSYVDALDKLVEVEYDLKKALSRENRALSFDYIPGEASGQAALVHPNSNCLLKR
ncbi:MAG: hypothetical protein HYX59_08530 [Elusimicrobia bacterium]|nr:hypothetical protein [Elusimicrobiota bacterium]